LHPPRLPLASFPPLATSDINHQKVLDLWKGGSRRPGAIFESVNLDRDIAILHKIKV
jgi:hypothetical protein